MTSAPTARLSSTRSSGPSIIVDAGPLIALFDRDDRHHRRAVEFVRGNSARLVSNLPVLTEASFVLRFSVDAQRDLLWWAQEAIDIDQSTAADLPRIIALLHQYRDLPAAFADVSLVALAERLNLKHVASFDRDFLIYRLSDKRRFENVLSRGD
jgi:predicted nucleic acid-binding protein